MRFRVPGCASAALRLIGTIYGVAAAYDLSVLLARYVASARDRNRALSESLADLEYSRPG